MAPRGDETLGKPPLLALSRILPLVGFLGLRETSQKCALQERGRVGWSRGLWASALLQGFGTQGVTPPLPGAFWTPDGFRINGVWDGSWAWRRQSFKPSSVRLPCRFGVLQRKLRHGQQHGQSLPCGGGGSEGASSSSSPSPRKSEKRKNSFALIFTKLLIGLR